MRKRRLSAEQAFAAMAVFLERCSERGGATDEIAILLGDLQASGHDGLPLDPATWDDWLAAVDEVLAKVRHGQPAAAEC